MTFEVEVLRNLAYRYSEIANSERNYENIKLHKAVNDLKQIRPVVLIDELPWSEMNFDNELTLICEDPFMRGIEWFLRMNIYKHKYMCADMVVTPFFPVYKTVKSTGIGIAIKQETLATDKDNNIVAHKYSDILKTEEDLEKIKLPVITYDKADTERRYELIGDIFGDILPIKLTGVNFFKVAPWDAIAQYRGVDNLLMDLADRPDFMHRIVSKLTECDLSMLDQYEALDLFEERPYNLHCTPALTNDLPGKSFDGTKLTRKNIWGRGTAQIFATVSKDMHDEFDISYMIKTIGQCGLTYYGCCEPLDNKIDIVEKIPNLRKISITPWANVNIAAEAIGNKYVLSAKTNPSSVAVPLLNKDNLKKEIKQILDACKRNNCNCDIVLKDISTCCKRPQNIFEWQDTVMDLVKNY